MAGSFFYGDDFYSAIDANSPSLLLLLKISNFQTNNYGRYKYLPATPLFAINYAELCSCERFPRNEENQKLQQGQTSLTQIGR